MKEYEKDYKRFLEILKNEVGEFHEERNETNGFAKLTPLFKQIKGHGFDYIAHIPNLIVCDTYTHMSSDDDKDCTGLDIYYCKLGNISFELNDVNAIWHIKVAYTKDCPND